MITWFLSCVEPKDEQGGPQGREGNPERELNHERLWTPENSLGLSEGRGQQGDGPRGGHVMRPGGPK